MRERKAVGPRLFHDRAGRVLVEYLVLLAIVAVGLVAMVGPVVGAKLVTEFSARRALLYSHEP